IWNSGITEPTLTEDDMNALSAYLDAGGNLFLNGADIAYQLADPASPYYTQNSLNFFTNYLHGSYIAHQFFTLSVDGVNGDPITNGIFQMKLFGGTGANNLGVSTGKYPNEIAPGDTNAMPIFTFWYSPNKVAGIRANHLNGKVVFTVFGFETIGEDSLRNKLARRIMEWFLPATAIGGDNNPQLITQLELNQNYPNPFNPETKISYALPQNSKSQKVTLTIYNQLGQQVRMLVNESKPSGRYDVVWDGRDDSGNQVASGVYVYQIRYGEHSAARKMILMR
ncbi:MAG: FlgD immunoglobulin-like domain containing protein, partial [Calditrichia bacterium]